MLEEERIHGTGKGMKETMTSSDYPEAYIAYLAEYYGSRDYFECHEIMEEYWKEGESSEYESCWLVLIRVAVAQYHARRGNWKGAIKLMDKAARETEAAPGLFKRLGVDGAALGRRLRSAVQEWSGPAPAYRDLELPIVDEALTVRAKEHCRKLGYEWSIPGLKAGDDIIHRHLTRDRQEVVSARAESAKRKSLSRESSLPERRSRT
ncbi:DUF309 domain-containing protein [Cohnella boryungensis]|uniref:DUF309 domain-containing protein n=2 Tax=Cohnella boryungensis TaxID=768479 RepID=A0ABV8SBU2_9BACL